MTSTQTKKLKKQNQLRDNHYYKGMTNTQKKRLEKNFQLRDEDEEGKEQHRSHTGMTHTQKKSLKRKFQRRDEDDEGKEEHRSHTGMAHTQTKRLKRKLLLTDEDDDGNDQHRSHTVGGNEQYRSHNVTVEGGNNVVGNIKIRGPTMMAKIWGLPRGHPKMIVLSNALGQPIGRMKTTFVEFIGSVARNGDYAPINLKSWHHMPLKKKKDMIAIVKEKFEVPPGMEYWMVKAFGRRWKNWKAYLKARYYNENVPIDSQVIKDSRVFKDQWEEIIDYWRTDEAKRMSKRNKRTRQKKVIHHRTGKTSFAQVYDVLKDDKNEVGPPTRVRLFKACYLDENQNAKSSAVANVVAAMDERTSQLPDGFHDKIAPDDVFAQVMGKDRNGQVRMMGGGVAPSDLWDSFPSRGASYRMALEYKSALDKQSEISKMLMAELAEIRAVLNLPRGASFVNTSSARSVSSVQTSRPLQVDTFVAMKSMCHSSKTVAEGILQSLDPTCVVGGQMLGKGWCSILVQVLVDPLEQLIRPFDMFETIGDVVGISVAWPKHLVFNADV